ncbi:MAG: hypothetical protein ABSH09_20015, partial [Bryobacteraceae bacterium]
QAHGHSVEEHVEKITGYFRFLPGAARLRPLFFITLGGPQAHGHSLPVTARLRVEILHPHWWPAGPCDSAVHRLQRPHDFNFIPDPVKRSRTQDRHDRRERRHVNS